MMAIIAVVLLLAAAVFLSVQASRYRRVDDPAKAGRMKNLSLALGLAACAIAIVGAFDRIVDDARETSPIKAAGEVAR